MLNHVRNTGEVYELVQYMLKMFGEKSRENEAYHDIADRVRESQPALAVVLDAAEERWAELQQKYFFSDVSRGNVNAQLS